MASPNGNYTEFTPQRRALLLEYLASGYNLTGASAKVGIHRRTAYLHCTKDHEYAQAVEEAREAGIDSFEDLIREKAHILPGMPGVVSALAWLKAHRREKWGDKLETTTRVSVQIIMVPAPTAEELRAADDRMLPATYNVLPSPSEAGHDADST